MKLGKERERHDKETERNGSPADSTVPKLKDLWKGLFNS